MIDGLRRASPAPRPRAGGPLRVLFVCGRNRLRSPTAERVFSDRPELEVASAGLAHDSENPLTQDLIDWAEVILVMEPSHRSRLVARHRRRLGGKRVACLGIPDRYEFMDPELVRLLESKAPPHMARRNS